MLKMLQLLKWCARFRLPLLLLCLTLSGPQAVQAYSQVALSGSRNTDESPKIFKAMNMDLIFPQTFNVTAPTLTTTTTTQYAADSYALQYEATTRPTIFITPAAANAELQPADIYQNEQQPQLQTAQKETQLQKQQLLQQQIAQEQIERQQLQQLLQEQQLQQEQLQQQQLEEQKIAQQQIEQQQQAASTGRAIDYGSTYQLGQLIKPLMKNSARPAAPSAARPVAATRYTRPLQASVRSSSSSGLSRLIYPQSQQQRQPNRATAAQWRQPPQISHRFSPGEATASAHFLKQQHEHRAHAHTKSNAGKVAAATNIVQSYVPPKNLYAFPPNLHVNYPSPSEDPKASVPTGSVSSYLAPASGPLSNSGGYPLAAASSNSNGYKYKGPLNLDYLPPDDQKDNNSSGSSDDDGNDNVIGVLPASAMDATAGDTNGASADDAAANMDTPPTDAHDHDHDHDHHHDHDDHHDHDHSLSGYDTGMEYPTPPPGWLEDHPDAAQDAPKDAPDDAPPAPADDHDHHHDEHDDHHFDFPDAHDHFPSFPGYSSFHHHYPDIIYDDHPHHHHHHEPPSLPITTISPLPEPEPAPEARVKKYSYFYIGRKLWYIPLYFTVWFSFYVLWLILKSIARHKVNLPNHYVNRRSLPENFDANTHEYINQLTVRVLEQIDGFKLKYLT